MTNIQGTAIIRDRGQLTIPGKIRNFLQWFSPSSVVSLITQSESELVIRPYREQKAINWIEIWSRIKESRSFEGKRGNLSKFITLDRKSH